MELDLEHWRAFAEPVYDVFAQEPVEQAGVTIEVGTISDLFVSRLTAPKQLLVHDPSLRKETNHEYLLFERFHTGGGYGEVGDTAFTAAPERLHLIDMSQRYVSMKQSSSSEGVCIPHSIVSFVRGVDPSFASLPIDSPKGRLLAAAHRELCEMREHPSSDDARLMMLVFVELIRRFMLDSETAEPPDKECDLSIGALLRNYVTTALQHADLDACTLGAAFGLSRSAVYRHFAAEGGVTTYIRNCRLDRCFYELAGSRPSHGRISTIARRWQFHDPSNFNRLFRKRFGISPSECLGSTSHDRNATISRQSQIVQAWFNQAHRSCVGCS